MKVSKITSIGRPVDFNYPTNRTIALLALAVVAGGALVQFLRGVAWGESALWGLQAGLSVFLAWALCREFDPDHALSAFVAAGLSLVSLFLWELPRLGVLFWLLLVMRVVNRTTGLPAGLLDALGVLGLGGWLALQGNWGYGVITALVFLLDSALAPRSFRPLIFAGLDVMVTAVVAVVSGNPAWGDGPSLASALMTLGMSLLCLPVVLASGQVESVGDETGERLSPVRVQAGQAVALLAGVETAFWGGAMGLVSLAPLWAAALGSLLYWAYATLVNSIVTDP